MAELTGGIELLSRQETRVYRRLLSGATFADIAEDLRVSRSVVKNYGRRVYKKLSVTGLKELRGQITLDGDEATLP